MSNKAYLANQVIESSLLVTRLEPNQDICYLQNVDNKAKVSLGSNQIFKVGENYFKIEEVMDDYIIVSPQEDWAHDDEEFVVNEDIFAAGDLILTKIDNVKGICYCHSIGTDAKVSFYKGQRIQIGDIVYRLADLTEDFARFQVDVTEE
jgi:hypothetical protein